MTLVRSHHSFDDEFTQIPNAWLRDGRLSLKAIGLLAQIMSHKPGWKLSITSLAQANNCGKSQISSAISELEEFGYLTRSQPKDNLNRFQEVIWTTSDPIAEKPMTENPLPENPSPENRTTKNTIPLEQQVIEQQVKKLPQKIEDEFDEFWNLYPRKVGKAEAKRAYAKAVGSHGSLDVLSGVIRLANDPNLPETRYIPHPATWLNRGGWDDEPYPAKQSNAQAKEQRQEQAAQRFLEAFSQPTKEIISDIDWNVL